jgi:prephenate dehydrogenase
VGFRKITVLGVGLMGASFARAVKKHSLCSHVSGYGRTEENLVRAVERGIIDSYDTDPRRACEGANLVVFATPVGRFEKLATEIDGVLKEGAVVIDVGSIKGPLVDRMEDLMPAGVSFLGCHPIAGSEQSGIDASSEELFEGAVCVITPTDKTDKGVLSAIRDLWEALGSDVSQMSPEEHDRIFGLVSHFPHLAAYALVSSVDEVQTGCLKYAGQGFLDTTRIAMSSPSLWREICLMNRDNILVALEAFRETLDRFGRHLSTGDAEGLEEAFGRARKLRESIEG